MGDALIGRQSPGAEQVFPGPHAWNGSYTDLRLSWKGHELPPADRARRRQPGHARDPAAIATHLRAPTDPCLLRELSLEPPRQRREAAQSDRSSQPTAASHHLLHLRAREAGARREPAHRRRRISPPTSPTPSASAPAHRSSLDKIHAIIARASEAYNQSVAAQRQSRRCSGRHPDRPRLGHHLRARRPPRHLPRQPRLERRLGRLCHLRLGHLFRRHHGLHRRPRPGLCRCHRDPARAKPPQGFVPNYARVRRLEKLRPLRAAGRRHHRARHLPALSRSTGFCEKPSRLCCAGIAGGPQHRDVDGYLAWGSDGDKRAGQPGRQRARNPRRRHPRVRPRQQPHVRRHHLQPNDAPAGVRRRRPHEHVHRRLRRPRHHRRHIRRSRRQRKNSATAPRATAPSSRHFGTAKPASSSTKTCIPANSARAFRPPTSIRCWPKQPRRSRPTR